MLTFSSYKRIETLMKKLKLKDICVNLFLVLCTIALAIFIFEIYLRLFNPQYVQPLEYSRTRLWQYVPNYESKYSPLIINSEGLRDYEHSYERKNGTIRILVLGDSFIEGAQVSLDNTFSKQLERMLNSSLEAKYETINAGFSMYGNDQELVYLEEEGLMYRPDTLILGFFVGNDVYNNRDSNIYLIENDNLVKNLSLDSSFGFKANMFLSSHSHAYILYKKAIKIIKFAIASKNLHNSSQLSSMPSMDIFRTDNRLDPAWLKTFLILKEIKMLCDNNNISLVMMIIPDKMQVDEEAYTNIFGQLNLSSSEFDIRKPQEKLLNFSRHNNITAIDLLPYFLDEEKNKTLYLRDDSHWSEEGHAFAARIVADRLRCLTSLTGCTS
jgi:lysophospholipase L1-like esterase